MNKILWIVASLMLAIVSNVQAKTVRALFIGNSYTGTNDLPALISQLARSTDDTLIYESVTPGGYRFEQHAATPETINLIQEGNWDYVILQEQSQLPSFGDAQVAAQVYPYARALDSMIKVSNPCATTLFYMTWGRKNGDYTNCPYFPVLCTYEGMDSMLQLRYTIMAEHNNAAIAPVAKVWRAIINEHPTIDLYSGDESHPSMEGSFAAACTFYSIMFRKDPTATSYFASIPIATASTIQAIAKRIVYDSIHHWNRYEDDYLAAQYEHSITDLTVSFTNTSINADTYHWDFGDGYTSTDMHPVHLYESHGTYLVQLTVKKADCSVSESFSAMVNINPTSMHNPKGLEKAISIIPNPASNQITVRYPADSYAIQITDIFGRNVLNPIILNAQQQEQIINIGSLPSGQYFVTAHSDKYEIVTQAFIKQ